MTEETKAEKATALRLSISSSVRAMENLLKCSAVMQNRELVDEIGRMVEVLYDLEPTQTKEKAKALVKAITAEGHSSRKRFVEAGAGVSTQSAEEFLPLVPRQYSQDELATFARKLH